MGHEITKIQNSAGFDPEYAKLASEFKRKEEIRERNVEIYKASSKKQLMRNIERKFKTTMIGALARFEKKFGFLWGQGKDELTEQELKYKQLWDEARTEILDNGNNQLRIAQEEIAQYTLSWEKYKADFKVTEDIKENKNES